MLPHAPVPQPTVDVHYLPVHAACTEKRGKPTCIGASGEQTLVPVIQRGQGEGLIQAAGGLQQHIQQAFHLGAGGRLLPSQGKAQTARD